MLLVLKKTIIIKNHESLFIYKLKINDILTKYRFI